VAHFSATASFTGACLSGHRSRVATARHDATSRSCHARTHVKGHPEAAVRSRQAVRSHVRRLHCPSASASASASPHCSHPAASHRLVSHITPLPVAKDIIETVRSLVTPLPHLLHEPLHHVECSAIMPIGASPRTMHTLATSPTGRPPSSAATPAGRR
jgi:hypothetical protein